MAQWLLIPSQLNDLLLFLKLITAVNIIIIDIGPDYSVTDDQLLIILIVLLYIEETEMMMRMTSNGRSDTKYVWYYCV